MVDQEVIERIKYYEEIHDKGFELLPKLRDLLIEYEEFIPKIKELEKYYTDGTWIKDYNMDALNEIPKDLKRGVLSEDSVYNLLIENDEIKKFLK